MFEQNQILGGHYKILRALGEGGLAKTYLAQDLYRPGNPVCVIKCLKPAQYDPAFMAIARRLFAQEAEALEKLGRHSQIPRLLAYFEDPEAHAFLLVQEYIEGQTLAQELATQQQWSEEKAIAFLKESLNVLSFVHEHNVIHRDIKPGNLIRCESDGRIILIDFGAVKQMNFPSSGNSNQSSDRYATVAIGTLGYIPAEQLRRKPRLNSDLYALGMVTIQALTGIDPVELKEDKQGEIIWRNFASVSDAFADVLNHMVRYHFKDRAQSAVEVLEKLKGLKVVSPGGKPHAEQDSSLAKCPQDLPSAQTRRAGMTTTPQLNVYNALPTTELLQPSLATLQASEESQSEKSDTFCRQASRSNAFPHFRKRKKATVGIVGVGLALMTGGAVFGGMSMSRDVAIANVQQQLESLHGQQEFAQCTTVAQAAIREQQLAKTKIQSPMDQCRLGLAQQQGEQKQFAKAIELATLIPTTSDHYQKAQKLIDQWSQTLLEQATQKYEQQGQLEEAIATVQPIPTQHSLRQKVDSLILTWKTTHQTNTKLLEGAEAALNKGQAEVAIATVSSIKSPTYWQEKAEQLKTKAQQQIAARQTRRVAPTTSRTTITTIPSRSQPVQRQVRSPRTIVTPRRTVKAKPTVKVEPRPKVVVKICPGPLCNK